MRDRVITYVVVVAIVLACAWGLGRVFHYPPDCPGFGPDTGPCVGNP